MVGSCGKKGLVWSVVKSGEGTVDNWILQSRSYYVITTDHSGSLSVLSVKKANIITESRLFLFVYFHVLYSWEDSTPGTLSSLIHTLNNLMTLRSVHFYLERLKMFRLFFLMTLAIFLAVSFGTSQNNSSHQVTSKRQIIQYCTFGAVNYSDCSRE